MIVYLQYRLLPPMWSSTGQLFDRNFGLTTHFHFSEMLGLLVVDTHSIKNNDRMIYCVNYLCINCI